MSASRTSFAKRIQAIKNFLESQKLHGRLLSMRLDGLGAEAAALEEVVREIQADSSENRLDMAIFHYKSVIISLYGALESLAESLVVEFIHFLNNTVPKFNDLPEPVRGNHDSFSAELLLDLERLEKYEGVTTVSEIVKNLYACQAKGVKYVLNALAFTRHSSNFRLETLSDLFKYVGISGFQQRLKLERRYATYYRQLNPGVAYNQLNESTIFGFLDELASRRNDVAHGAEDLGDILSTQALGDLTQQLEVCGHTMCDIVDRARLPFIQKYKAIPLPNAIVVYNNRIVCFNLVEIGIEAGDYLLCHLADEDEWRIGEILEMQVNSHSLRVLPPQREVKVALRVGYRAKGEYAYFLVRRPGKAAATVGDGWATVPSIDDTVTGDMLKLFQPPPPASPPPSATRALALRNPPQQ